MQDEDLTVDGVDLMAELLAGSGAAAAKAEIGDEDLTLDGPSLLRVLGSTRGRWVPPARESFGAGVVVRRGLDRWKGLPVLLGVVSLLVGFLLALTAFGMNQTAVSPTGTTVLSQGEP